MSAPKKPTPIRHRRRRNSKPKLVMPAVAVDSSLAVDLPEEEDEDTEDLPAAAALQVDIPPAEPQGQSFLDRAKAKLGFASDEKQDVEPKPKATSGRLTKGQAQFVDLVAPIAQQAGVMAADFAWGHIAGPEYVPYLLPSNDVAGKIMIPLTRIAARMISIKYKGHVSPNQIDAAASLTAVAGYVLSSWKLYSEIKKEERNGTFTPQEEARNGARASQSRGSVSRGTVNAVSEARYDAASAQSVRSADVEAVSAVPQPGEAGGHSYPGQSGSPDLGSLTESERRAYEKLHALSVRDYESRRRRAGIPPTV